MTENPLYHASEFKTNHYDYGIARTWKRIPWRFWNVLSVGRL